VFKDTGHAVQARQFLGCRPIVQDAPIADRTARPEFPQARAFSREQFAIRGSEIPVAFAVDAAIGPDNGPVSSKSVDGCPQHLSALLKRYLYLERVACEHSPHDSFAGGLADQIS